MTTDRIQQIKARVEAATEGPWEYEGAYALENIFTLAGAPEGRQISIADQASLADAEFITHAREDVPFLLAEVERLTAECDDLRAAVERVRAKCVQYDDIAIMKFATPTQRQEARQAALDFRAALEGDNS